VIVGASGSGKTTLLKTINRLQDPDFGAVEIDGRPVGAGPDYQLRRGVGYVFQEVGLFPHLSVAENIGVTPRLLGWERPRIRARTEALIDLVGLPRALLERRPEALSGGQRQRIGLARALAAQPKIMLLDEPFGALDAVTRDTLGRDYKRIHQDLGLTTVMITHDMMEALILADQIAVMRSGRILQDAPPAEILSEAAHPYVQELVATPRRQAEAVARLRADSR
jgi:osmoprotectant transport system ATP-binding protein